METLFFKYQPFSRLREIRLVTILPDKPPTAIRGKLSHVDMNSNPHYECLSYAWGAGDGEEQITIDGFSFLVSSTLLVALEHLRHPSEARKMWIDAICINQTDIGERSQQVAIMQEIYQHATRVIVWLGPPTESSEKAMAFLTTMAASWERYRSQRILSSGIARRSQSSSASSKWGAGEAPAAFWSNEIPATPVAEDRTEIREDNNLSERHESHQGQSIVVSPFIEPGETSPLLPLPPTWHEVEGHETSKITIWERLQIFLQRHITELSIWQSLALYVESLSEFFTRSPFFQRREDKFAWQEGVHYSEPDPEGQNDYSISSIIHFTNRTDHVITEYPIQYKDGLVEFFDDEWEAHWQSLDELLARPWWGRTWIVQEVWCASKILLQCGTTKIEWKEFQDAMDYSEGWDQMGDRIKGTRREAEWGTLRRRYTLAIHLAKARVKNGAFSSLLWNTWDRESTDPRDKVFAIQALVNQAEDIPAPDYTKSMRQVYCEVARDIIANKGQMDILLAASGTNNSSSLPSWVPDWRCEANAKKPTLLVNRGYMMTLFREGSMAEPELYGHGYHASGNSKPVAWFSKDLSVLTVLAKKVDSVAEIGGADIEKFDDDHFIQESVDFVRRSKSASAKIKLSEEAAGTNNPDSIDVSLVISVLAGGWFREEDQSLVIRNTMRQRRLLVSKQGYIGIGPVDTQVGDVVFIISGCNFPMVLRPRKNKFIVVGEAYVHGFMHEEFPARSSRPWRKIYLV
ncbi:hypothetical protein BS50DRAFT_579418 [Corynespora cassiicola Philippines]|uniref:Heterokaryon incompatibility domain-containing protein n=1 Tax=Corynespora cassiicola Philippines TaxID=1448308 RepID=A0A2T2N5H3_CORCC|nr:hypothetical protein BS50DRAFT_579418 [Corynespora cassiicola Philippines]